MTTRPSIGVNLCWLVPGVVGGSERSTVELLRAMADLDDPPDLRLYGSAELLAAHPDLASAFPTTVVPASLSARPLRVGVEATWLASATRHHDLVHHLGGTVPPVRSTPSVLTVHDIQPLDHPDRFSPAKRTWLATMIPRSVDAARVICVPSAFTADRLRVRLGVERQRIRVVPHAIPSRFGGADGDVASGDRGLDAIHPGLGSARFVLYPAITHPHKGHGVLIDAAAHWPDDLHLVLPGGTGASEEDVRRRIATSPAARRIHRPGRVPDDVLEVLYDRAAAVAVPSDYEGFGLPAVEAMRRGVPVVVCAGGSSAEVVADAGIIVPADRPDALAEAVGRLLTDRGTWAARGRDRARDFEPPAAAAAQVAAYRDALVPVASDAPSA